MDKAGYATARWRARYARRYPPPPDLSLRNPTFFSIYGSPNPPPLDQSVRPKHHHSDPQKQTPGGRHQIGTPAGFKSESVADFRLECVAGFVGIRSQANEILRKASAYFAQAELDRPFKR